jgi:hypothetical protein
MKTEQFDILLEQRISKIREILSVKAKEYSASGSDRLHNFKRASSMLNCSNAEAWRGFFMKHMVSIFDIIDGKLSPTEHNIDEKIGDAINYLILLEMIYKENL